MLLQQSEVQLMRVEAMTSNALETHDLLWEAEETARAAMDHDDDREDDDREDDERDDNREDDHHDDDHGDDDTDHDAHDDHGFDDGQSSDDGHHAEGHHSDDSDDDGYSSSDDSSDDLFDDDTLVQGGEQPATTLHDGLRVALTRADADVITDFEPETDLIALPLSLSDQRIKVKTVDSRSALRRAFRSKASLVYDAGSGYLYYNANGKRSGLGTEGGVLAWLENQPDRLTRDHFLSGAESF